MCCCRMYGTHRIGGGIKRDELFVCRYMLNASVSDVSIHLVCRNIEALCFRHQKISKRKGNVAFYE